MNLEQYPYTISNDTVQAICNINPLSKYFHIPLTNETQLFDKFIDEFIQNVDDGFIFMPKGFLWNNKYANQRKKLFEKTNVYHVMINFNKTFAYTIFCNKNIKIGKSSILTTIFSLENSPKLNYTVDITGNKIKDIPNFNNNKFLEGFDFANVLNVQYTTKKCNKIAEGIDFHKDIYVQYNESYRNLCTV